MGKRKMALLPAVVVTTLALAWGFAMPAPPQAAALATLSGTVDSAASFKAAQVYIRNVDKRILYMVYTNAGQFRAVSLFPGNYEISVAARGMDSDVQKLALKAGDSDYMMKPFDRDILEAKFLPEPEKELAEAG